MPTSVSSTKGFPVGLPSSQAQVLGLSNAASADTRNISRGSTTVRAVLVDNQKDAVNSNARIWVKIYDATAGSWTPGTTASIIGFPVEAWNSPADAQLTGTYQLVYSRNGIVFDKGLSAAASRDAGESVATAIPSGGEPALEIIYE